MWVPLCRVGYEVEGHGNGTEKVNCLLSISIGFVTLIVKMLIANPLYDTIFKYLLSDNRVAKLIISTIIDEPIETLRLQPQEQQVLSEKRGIHVYRIDFAATLKTKSGKQKKVLIEIQKAKFKEDLLRFRRYLGEQYSQADPETGKPLPIITIYILGFGLEDLPFPAIKVNREYMDAITGEKIRKESSFIEKLTHNAYVIQVPYLTQRRRNKLEALLSIFDQSHRQTDKYVLELKEHLPKEFTLVENRLKAVTSDKGLRDKIALEEEVEDLFESLERNYTGKLEEKDHVIEEKDQEIQKTKQQMDHVIEEKDQMIEQKDHVIEQKDQMIEQKDHVIEQKDQEIQKTKQQMDQLMKWLSEKGISLP